MKKIIIIFLLITLGLFNMTFADDSDKTKDFPTVIILTKPSSPNKGNRSPSTYISCTYDGEKFSFVFPLDIHSAVVSVVDESQICVISDVLTEDCPQLYVSLNTGCYEIICTTMDQDCYKGTLVVEE